MKEILIVSLSNIGDVILTTPVIMALARQFPEARLTVVVGPRAFPLLEGSRAIHKLVIYDKKAGLAGQFRFLKLLRRVSYDMVVDLRHTLIPFLVKTQRRSPIFRLPQNGSVRDRHLNVLQAMGFSISGFPCFDFFGAAEEQSFLSQLRGEDIQSEDGWVIASPVAASGLKTWKFEGFRSVLARLLELTDREILLVGDSRERKVLEGLTAIHPRRIFNLAGRTTLRELAFAVSRSSLVLCNDSAVMHLGYELNRPVVAIFGPTSHIKYGRSGPQFRMVRAQVPCSPCERPVCRFSRQHCFEDLKAETVLAACKDLLREPLTSF